MPGAVAQMSDGVPADSSTAPIHTVPQERVISIEHPCIVRNFDNGLKSLGGEPQMKHVSITGQQSHTELHLLTISRHLNIRSETANSTRKNRLKSLPSVFLSGHTIRFQRNSYQAQSSLEIF